MTETIEDKAHRLLTTDRIFVKWSTPGHVCAVVHGETGIYDVDLHQGRWNCTCQARTTCGHLAAVMAVTVPHETPETPLDARLPSRLS